MYICHEYFSSFLIRQCDATKFTFMVLVPAESRDPTALPLATGTQQCQWDVGLINGDT